MLNGCSPYISKSLRIMLMHTPIQWFSKCYCWHNCLLCVATFLYTFDPWPFVAAHSRCCTPTLCASVDDNDGEDGWSLPAQTSFAVCCRHSSCWPSHWRAKLQACRSDFTCSPSQALCRSRDASRCNSTVVIVREKNKKYKQTRKPVNKTVD